LILLTTVKRLVVVAPNWLGDAVMALPAIADVRRAWPDASIALAARPSVAALFTLTPEADEVVTLTDNRPSALAGREITLLLPNSFQSALTAKRAGVPERWGYSTDWRGFLLTRAVPRPPAGLHQIAYYQRLVAALGFANGPSAPRIDAEPAVRDAGAGALRKAGWDGRTPVVALAPGAAYGSSKRWAPHAFADLAAGLADDGVATVLVGAPADRATAAEVLHAGRGRAVFIDLVGQTDVPALAGVLTHCRALVANDSGALHLAAALGVSVTAVYGPTDERLTAPVARGQWLAAGEPPITGDRPLTTDHPPLTTDHPPQVTVMTNPVWCRPCWLRECPLDRECMQGITPASVLDETRRML
jgi:heptosyltransferase-2